MKRNKMMRIASVLLIVTILSTCAISGTFAKYVVTGSGSDSARIARFGVEIEITGNSMFKNKYAADDTSVSFNTVMSSDGEDVVAPGTKGDGFSATIGVTGDRPEVAIAYRLGFSDLKDIVLESADGEIYDETVPKNDPDAAADPDFDAAVGYKKVDVPVDYAPVKFHILFNGKAVSNSGEIQLGDQSGDWDIIPAGITLTQFKNADPSILPSLTNASTSNTVSAEWDGTDMVLKTRPGWYLDGTLKVTWEWAFEGNTGDADKDHLIDIYDTYLGNHTDEYGPLSFTFNASAVQID